MSDNSHLPLHYHALHVSDILRSTIFVHRVEWRSIYAVTLDVWSKLHTWASSSRTLNNTVITLTKNSWTTIISSSTQLSCLSRVTGICRSGKWPTSKKQGVENDGLENDGLEHDGVEQEQTYMLQTKTNFNAYDPLRHEIVLNTNLTTDIFQHLQLYLLKKMNKQKKS